ncbi:hypothetical protein [Flavobacterium sp.]|uniref:hypothetical protein n=1 Tax=Flavobacterium sp. TaxID=239 RepID=UPI002626D7B4|nr:hypothetical protein [Flavobacterium sp.]
MLNCIQNDLRELLELVRDTAAYDATLAASQQSGKPIVPTDVAATERTWKGARIVQLKQKYDL